MDRLYDSAIKSRNKSINKEELITQLRGLDFLLLSLR
jgi:hypothetical protein